MARAINDVRQGRRTYTASGALSEGMLVAPAATAGQVVASPAAIAPCMVAVSDATNGTDVEVEPIQRGAEYRFIAAVTITAGQEVEIGATTNIGKLIVAASGVKVGRAQEAAAANGLVRVIAY